MDGTTEGLRRCLAELVLYYILGFDQSIPRSSMLGAAVAIFLWLLPLQVNGLITTDAKCLSGYEWVSLHFIVNFIIRLVATVYIPTFSLIGPSTSVVAEGPCSSC